MVGETMETITEDGTIIGIMAGETTAIGITIAAGITTAAGTTTTADIAPGITNGRRNNGEIGKNCLDK